MLDLDGSPGQNVYQFEQIRLRYVLSYGVKSLPLEVLLPKGLKKLIAYDKENHTDYCDTLHCYLKNGDSITETVNQMYMHRSTVKYRMQRIREIMGSELTDGDEVMYLSVMLFYMKEL